MEENLRKEEHRRFQRAQDARSSQADRQKDEYKHMTGEELTIATEEYVKNNPDGNHNRLHVHTYCKTHQNSIVGGGCMIRSGHSNYATIIMMLFP